MKEFFIYERGLQSGPYSIDELRLKTIHTYTPVWKQGLLDWVNAGELEELAPLFSSIQSYKATSELAVNLPATLSTHSGRPGFNNNKLAMGSALLVVAIITIWTLAIRNENPEALQASSAIVTKDYREMEQGLPSQYISGKFIDQQTVKGQRMINLELYNNATMAGYRDIVLSLVYFSAKGIELGTEIITINESIPAGQSLKTQINVKSPSSTSDVKIGIVSAGAAR